MPGSRKHRATQRASSIWPVMASVPPLLAPKDRDSILELVVDRVLVAMERFQSGDLNPLAERVAAVTKPRLVGLASGPDLVQQPGPEVSVLVTGQIDHAGELLRPASALVDGLVET